VSVKTFDELLDLIYDKTAKRDTVMRRSIHPAERLAITLSLHNNNIFLVQGRGVHVTGVSAAYTFKLNKNILSE
jgi:hypothetical protein